jgi:sortase (surface protein transpeptidase)
MRLAPRAAISVIEVGIPVDPGRPGVLCCSGQLRRRGIDMDQDIRSGGSPGIVLPGDSALAGALSEAPPSSILPPQNVPRWDIDADWWGPAWDTVTSVGRTEPAGGVGEPRDAARRPPRPVTGSGASPSAGTDPSWRQTLATTVSLWRSRRQSAVGRARLRLVSVAVLGAGLLAAGAGAAGLIVASGSPASALRLPAHPSPVAVPSGHTMTTTWQSAVQPAPKPVHLTIPAIGVRAAVTTLGLNQNGTLQVPGNTVETGWYTNSPAPGAIGSAVIAGHVDSRAGPGVFFWLRNLRPGERVYVRRADGTLAIFTVTKVQTYAKNTFPTAAVYGSVPDAELRLITCGGTFDYASGSYLSNVVVYARLVS